MEPKEITGIFSVEKKLVESTGNYRTVVKGSDNKQVGSTFDDGLTARLTGFAPGIPLTVTVDKSGKFWNIIDVRLADVPAQAPAPAPAAPGYAPPAAPGYAPPAPPVQGYTPPAAPAPAPAVTPAPVSGGTFTGGDLTYFMGYSARLVAAAITADASYAARLAETGDLVGAAHTDVLRGALFLFHEANKAV